jgi:hypothetical protein
MRMKKTNRKKGNEKIHERRLNRDSVKESNAQDEIVIENQERADGHEENAADDKGNAPHDEIAIDDQEGMKNESWCSVCNIYHTD